MLAECCRSSFIRICNGGLDRKLRGHWHEMGMHCAKWYFPIFWNNSDNHLPYHILDLSKLNYNNVYLPCTSVKFGLNPAGITQV